MGVANKIDCKRIGTVSLFPRTQESMENLFMTMTNLEDVGYSAVSKSQSQSKARGCGYMSRTCRRLEEGEEDGPPDKHQHFQSDKPSRSIALVQSALVY